MLMGTSVSLVRFEDYNELRYNENTNKEEK